MLPREESGAGECFSRHSEDLVVVVLGDSAEAVDSAAGEARLVVVVRAEAGKL